MPAKRYHFEEVSTCEMCGDNTADHKVMGIRLNGSQGMRPKKKSGIAVSIKRCNSCGLIYSSPMPVPFDIQDHYGVPAEDYWKPSYFKWDETYFAHQIARLKNLVGFEPGMKALDIGAGIGKGMISLERAGFDVYGFEPSKSFYDKAISEMHISPERLKLGMIEEMEYEAASFDFINFGAVFEHLYHPAACLDKALHWLKPGGIIHIEVPSSKHLVARLINTYYRLIGTNYVTSLSPMHDPYHLYEFDLRSFEALGKRLDFNIVHHEYYVCEIYFFPKILHRPLTTLMQKTNTGMQLTVWLRKEKN